VRALLILSLLSAGACVSKKKYTELETQLAQTEGQLQTKSSEAMSLQEALAAEQANVTQLEAQIAALQAKNTALLSDKSELDASVQQMQAALAELAARKSEADARLAEFRDLLAKFKGLIDAGRLEVKIVAGRMVLVLPTDILFGSGSASLSKEGREAILEVAGVLATIEEREFQVEGHTDDVPISTETFPSNWHLASARAINVVKTLQEGGVPVTRLSAASFAENRPVDTNKTKEGKAANRRIEIVVVPDLSQLPGYSELEKLAQ
jgi:chemotaxis protein MotB